MIWGDLPMQLVQCQACLNGLIPAVGAVLIGLAGQRCWGSGLLSPTSESSGMDVPSTLSARGCHQYSSYKPRAALSNTVPTSHMWLLKFKLKLITIVNSVLQLCWQHCRCSRATCADWLLRRTWSTAIVPKSPSVCHPGIPRMRHSTGLLSV